MNLELSLRILSSTLTSSQSFLTPNFYVSLNPQIFAFSFLSSEKDLASQMFFQINFFYQNNFTYLLFFPAVLYYLFPKTRSGLNPGKALEHTRVESARAMDCPPYTINQMSKCRVTDKPDRILVVT